MKRWVWAVFTVLVIVAMAIGADAAKIKDIAGIVGVRDNLLVGYGLVAGLMGTGDDLKNGFGRETMANMLSRQGLSTKDRIGQIKSDNVASVMVTANLPPFVKEGARIDCTVSSIGDAKSLQGGTLIMTPLRATDGEVYAVCQGSLSIGGYSAAGAAASVTKNQTNVGIVPNGALVEKEVPVDLGRDGKLTINLFTPDFTTVREMVSRINALMENRVVAEARDSATVEVRVAPDYFPHIPSIIAEMENIDVPVTNRAVVVLNEKTGTVVMGEGVRISTVAVAHGNLSISIKETYNVSQPLPFSPRPPAGGVGPVTDKKGGAIIAPGAQTVVTKDTSVAVQEEKNRLMVVPQGVTISEVVQALNAIGVSPRDLISILQAIKAAGALQAELRII